MTVTRIGTNTGHGHAWDRPDGAKARCGGPGMCQPCAADKALVDSETATTTDRCPSCDHQAADHDELGCWYTVWIGVDGKDLACPCSMTGTQLAEIAEAAAR